MVRAVVAGLELTLPRCWIRPCVEAKLFDSCTGGLEPCIQNLYSARMLQMVRTILNKKREKQVESPHGGLRPVVCSSNR
jgi:hypothetical protein